MSTLTTYAHDPCSCHVAHEAQTSTLKELRRVINDLERDDCQRPYRGGRGCGLGQRVAPKEAPRIVYPNNRLPEHFKYGTYEKSESVPPWVLPRFRSGELVGGHWHKLCVCRRLNGLQDQCSRVWCRGRPACKQQPPVCPPSGIWKKEVSAEEAAKIISVFDEKERHLRAVKCQNFRLCDPMCSVCNGPWTGDTIKNIGASKKEEHTDEYIISRIPHKSEVVCNEEKNCHCQHK